MKTSQDRDFFEDVTLCTYMCILAAYIIVLVTGSNYAPTKAYSAIIMDTMCLWLSWMSLVDSNSARTM